MPELPEVEVTKRGLMPHIMNKRVCRVVIRQNRFRRIIPDELSKILPSHSIINISRRAKYLLFDFQVGFMLIHLGMSGSLRILLPEDNNQACSKHDHVDWVFADGTIMRYRDPRRFGLIDWFVGDFESYPAFLKLGVEPLSDQFNGLYLYNQLKNKNKSIKSTIMCGDIVVGVGNIYINEILFYMGIHPMTPSKNLTLADCEKFVSVTQKILQAAIEMGGSSLKDFFQSNGSAGYFQQHYAVYGRNEKACQDCGYLIEKMKIDGRSSFFCPQCQQ